MNIILLAGGSGKLLWPLSDGVRSKQFLQLFRAPDGSSESMLQRVYRLIKAVDQEACVTVATSQTQVPAVQRQLGDRVSVSAEPCRRDTFPAVVLAAAYLHYVRGLSLDETVAVCPADPYVHEDYFEAVRRMRELAGKDTARLILMGIEPDSPSEKYGYILPDSGEPVARVRCFREKPDVRTAQGYIDAGGLWNGGVFAFRLGYILEKARGQADFNDYESLLQNYGQLEKTSFDYAVAEREEDMAVLRFRGEWKDLGTWSTLTEAMEENPLGDVRLDEACRNVYAVNELGLPMLVMGLTNAVVSASPQGILVSDRERSGRIKPFVEQIGQRVLFAEKRWGSYRVLNEEKGSLTVRLTLNPGQGMSCHSHDHRDEVWTVLSGTGRAVVDGKERLVRPGDVILLPAGCRHTIAAGEEEALRLIEIQLGSDLSALDKRRYGPDG